MKKEAQRDKVTYLWSYRATYKGKAQISIFEFQMPWFLESKPIWPRLGHTDLEQRFKSKKLIWEVTWRRQGSREVWQEKVQYGAYCFCGQLGNSGKWGRACLEVICNQGGEEAGVFTSQSSQYQVKAALMGCLFHGSSRLLHSQAKRKSRQTAADIAWSRTPSACTGKINAQGMWAESPPTVTVPLF